MKRVESERVIFSHATTHRSLGLISCLGFPTVIASCVQPRPLLLSLLPYVHIPRFRFCPLSSRIFFVRPFSLSLCLYFLLDFCLPDLTCIFREIVN